MNLRKLLTSDVVMLNMQGTTKEAVIGEMVDRMVALGKISARDNALQTVLEREKRMSTGMQNGIAIPHGKTDAVDSIVVVLGIKPEGINFECLDGLPARIIILTLSPANRAGPHIQFMAEISRILNNPDTREKAILAPTPDELISILLG